MDGCRDRYLTSKQLFGRLRDLCNSLKPWIALGNLASLEEFVEKEISTLEEFENNFKMVKKRVKQVRDCRACRSLPLPMPAGRRQRCWFCAFGSLCAFGP